MRVPLVHVGCSVGVGAEGDGRGGWETSLYMGGRRSIMLCVTRPDRRNEVCGRVAQEGMRDDTGDTGQVPGAPDGRDEGMR